LRSSHDEPIEAVTVRPYYDITGGAALFSCDTFERGMAKMAKREGIKKEVAERDLL
jgi:hypothetical protein